MQNSEHVNDAQRLGDGAQVVQAFVDAQRIAQTIAQVAAGKVFHRQIQVPRQGAEIIDLGDGAMRDAGDDFVFALEAFGVVHFALAIRRGSSP